MAGESKIIATTEDFDEEQGRLRLMNNIGYAYDETNNWQACRAYYATIMVGIELGEEQWTSNFCRFETMLPKGGPHYLGDRVNMSKDKVKMGFKRRILDVVFCKEYQCNNCKFQTSHLGQYKDEPGKVNLEHCCAKCWLRNKVKLAHPEMSEACPYKQEQA